MATVARGMLALEDEGRECPSPPIRRRKVEEIARQRLAVAGRY